MPDRPAPPGVGRDLDHREVFARFVDRLATRLPRPETPRPSVRIP